MAFVEDSLTEWREELYADPAIAELEHELRSEAFTRMYKTLKLLNPAKKKALYFRTVTPELEPREVLIIDQPRNKRNLAGARVLVNDECLTPADITNRVVEGRSFQLRAVGNIITRASCTLPESPDGGWEIGQAGFLLQKADDPITYIRHGIAFRPDSLRDAPESDASILAGRREASESLHDILTGLVGVEPVITDYLFGVVTS